MSDNSSKSKGRFGASKKQRRDSDSEDRGRRNFKGKARRVGSKDGQQRRKPSRRNNDRRDDFGGFHNQSRGFKTPLATMGGRIHSFGDSAFSSLASQAWERASDEDSALDSTHGMHSYPARLHPAIASTMIQELASPEHPVFDPFCGAGTVLVEAKRLGFESFGSDLNPLATRLTWIKTRIWTQAELLNFRVHLEDIAALSEDRVRSRQPVRANLKREHLALYQPHIVKELAGLFEEIKKVESPLMRNTMELLFSAISTKFSKRRSDTHEDETPRRLRKGLVTEFFLRRGKEWIERLADFAHGVPNAELRSEAIVADSRKHPKELKQHHPFGLIVTSPPYAGVYDYVQHHAIRMDWLKIDDSSMRKAELGARRHADRHGSSNDWQKSYLQSLREMNKTLCVGAHAVIITGDGELDGRRIDARRQLEELAERSNFILCGGASQERAKTRQRKQEHILILKKAASQHRSEV